MALCGDLGRGRRMDGTTPMTNQFGAKIKSLEAQLNKLKTVGLSSSSSLGVAVVDIPIQFQMMGTRIVDGEILESGSSKIAHVHIQSYGNVPIILSSEVIMPDYTREVTSTRLLSNLPGFKYMISFGVWGNDDDLAAIRRGETMPFLNYTFRIKGTEQFNYQITYEDREVRPY